VPINSRNAGLPSAESSTIPSLLFRYLVMPVSFRCKALVPLTFWASAGIAVTCIFPTPVTAHGAAGGAELAPGEFQIAPALTIEGHAGLENNLEDRPRHYAIDGLIGVVMEWGLPNKGSFAVEAMLGPAFVWGEAEHFYGRVHTDHDEHSDEHSEEYGHAEAHEGAPFRRTDLKGQLQVRYDPNERLSFMVEWNPYYVTRNQIEDIKGLKNEVAVGVVWALGDGDVNFALGDGLETVADGVFLSLENRTGWESDGTYIGNYTDPWLGMGFNIDKLNVTLSGGPRFYSPGSYSGLTSRTDWGGELELALPVSPGTVLFAHWKPIFSSQGGEGWGRGWQHHIGTGVTFRF
jgi:hypothetical protein